MLLPIREKVRERRGESGGGGESLMKGSKEEGVGREREGNEGEKGEEEFDEGKQGRRGREEGRRKKGRRQEEAITWI